MVLAGWTMPVSSIEPPDPMKVWECKALQKHGNPEVAQHSVTAAIWQGQTEYPDFAGIDAAAAHSKASAACHAQARLESAFVV